MNRARWHVKSDPCLPPTKEGIDWKSNRQRSAPSNQKKKKKKKKNENLSSPEFDSVRPDFQVLPACEWVCQIKIYSGKRNRKEKEKEKERNEKPTKKSKCENKLLTCWRRAVNENYIFLFLWLWVNCERMPKSLF